MKAKRWRHGQERRLSMKKTGISTALLLYVLAASTGYEVATASAAAIGSVDMTNCAMCEGLQYCTTMNGKLLFDPVIGYTRERTSQLEKQGVCEDLDAKTNELSKFGDQYQFKDTPRCHTLVWNYHCLSLVAATFTRVVDGVAVTCAAGEKPLPPCRSLCVEVADKCVYSHFYRAYLENVCGNVACVSEEQEAASKGTLQQRACVKAPWESVPNTSFSRCSIREYVPPKAHASHLTVHSAVALVWCIVVVVSILR